MGRLPEPRTLLAALLTVSALLGGLMKVSVAQPAAEGDRSPPGVSMPAKDDGAEAFGMRVRTYLLEHPEVLVEAMQVLRARQERAQAASVKETIAARADEILHDPDAPVGGNPRGDVTLVEFFDYNCHYCRAVAPTVAAALDADPGVRLVYKEFPILGPSSELAARAALAARAQGGYAALHDALMSAEQPLNEEKILTVAQETGLDTDQLKRDMADPALGVIIGRNRALAEALGVTGTPGFVIGERVVPGAIDQATLENLIAGARAATTGSGG